MEEHFSINNRKIFRTTDGTVVEKIQPLTLSPGFDTLNALFATWRKSPRSPHQRSLLEEFSFLTS